MRHMGDFCPGPEALAGWLEQSFSAPERARVTAHLASCDECRRAVTIASAVEPQAAGVVDEALLQRVTAAARRRPIGAWAALAAAGLLAIGLLFWVSGKKPEPGVAVVTPPPTAHPAAEVKPPVAKTEPETPVVATPEVPPALPEKKRDPVTPEPAKEEPKKPVLVKEEPKPTPPKEEPAPAVKVPPRTTETDLSRVFGSVYVIDPSGDLWLNREGGEPGRVGRYEQVGYKDTLSARDAAGAFALEGKATMALEKGASATVAWKRLDGAYSLALTQGTVMVDTEGLLQKWEVTRGTTEVTFANLNGRLVVEPRGEMFAAVMLTGRTDVRIGSAARRLESGREMVLTLEGKVTEKAADSRKYARLSQLRPKHLTVFAATFEEKDETRAFPYTVPGGKLVAEASAVHLHAEVPPGSYGKAGEKAVASCLIKPDAPIQVVDPDTTVLRFRYRSNFPTFTIRLGKYSAVYTSRLKANQWGDGEITLAAFEFEGTQIVPGDEAAEIQFQGVVDGKKPGILDLDGVQFLRRSR